MLGSDVMTQRPEAKQIDCPFTGEKLLLIPALNPDVALIHWRWSISGVDNPDGSPAPVYRGIFTWVLVRTDGNWLIRAAQNTIGQ